MTMRAQTADLLLGQEVLSAVRSSRTALRRFLARGGGSQCDAIAAITRAAVRRFAVRLGAPWLLR